jgi:pimeloyl-ACP methyl ester carboxylesterase
MRSCTWQDARSWFLAAGYAVVVVDVRGTGASFGQWRSPWQPEERADSREVIDWIVSQPWSNQQVATSTVYTCWDAGCNPLPVASLSVSRIACVLYKSLVDMLRALLQCVLWGVSYDGECSRIVGCHICSLH